VSDCTWQRPDGRRCTQPADHVGRCTFPPVHGLLLVERRDHAKRGHTLHATKMEPARP